MAAIRKLTAICIFALFLAVCSEDKSTDTEKNVPHDGQWGIYVLNLQTQAVTLLYGTDEEIAGINLSSSGTQIAFSKKIQNGVGIDTTSEIYILDINSGEPTELTDNYYFDTYPSFSPDDTRIAFLSLRNGTLDIYVMNADGTNQQLIYDSGGHDADVDWGSGGLITFTRDYQIWTINSDGSNPQQVTDPPDAGQWGDANLPIGDYDPRFSPDGSRIAFERMVDVSYVHGGYDIYTISANGQGEISLTGSGAQGYAQGFPNWSHSGDKIVYILSAIVTEGKYELYMINSDGTDNHSIKPSYFPVGFLCHNAVFSSDDSGVYFIGQWWQ